MEGALLTVEICILCHWSFSNQFDIESQTPYSYGTVAHELYQPILCSLLCLKQTAKYMSESMIMCLFYLILKSNVLMFNS